MNNAKRDTAAWYGLHPETDVHVECTPVDDRRTKLTRPNQAPKDGRWRRYHRLWCACEPGWARVMAFYYEAERDLLYCVCSKCERCYIIPHRKRAKRR